MMQVLAAPEVDPPFGNDQLTTVNPFTTIDMLDEATAAIEAESTIGLPVVL
jgi:hypothetical protein